MTFPRATAGLRPITTPILKRESSRRLDRWRGGYIENVDERMFGCKVNNRNREERRHVGVDDGI